MEFIFHESPEERGAAGRAQPPVYGERGGGERKISVFSPGKKRRKREKKNEEVRKLLTFDKSF